MNAVRVLVISTVKLTYNGITSVVMNYYKNIDRNLIQFDFVAARGIDEWVKEEIVQLGGKVYELSYRDKRPLKYMKQLQKIILQNNYKIIHAHGNSGTLFFDIHAAKKANVPMRIAHCHNSTCKHKALHYLLKGKLNKELTNAFACSDLAGQWLYTDKYTVINNGINISDYSYDLEQRRRYRKLLNIQDNFLLGNVGHLSYQKNHQYLIEVFSEVKKLHNNSKLIIIGEGKLKDEIKNKINELGLEEDVIMLGKRDDINNLLQAMDVFIMTSRYEGLPVSLVEAQASGLACVVSDVITKEAQITGKVKFISLLDEKKKWAEEIVKCNQIYVRDDVSDTLSKSIYNIKHETEKLIDIYLQSINGKNTEEVNEYRDNYSSLC